MADAQPSTARLDMDILADIQRWIYTYPPLSHDRRHIHVSVEEGVAHISGNIKTPITRDYLRKHIREVPGVRQIEDSNLYDDDSIRLGLGNILPPGALANPEWGMVVLSGKLPTGEALDTLVGQIGQIAGVHKVVAVER
jgi:hypothetical protein